MTRYLSADPTPGGIQEVMMLVIVFSLVISGLLIIVAIVASLGIILAENDPEAGIWVERGRPPDAYHTPRRPT